MSPEDRTRVEEWADLVDETVSEEATLERRDRWDGRNRRDDRD